MEIWSARSTASGKQINTKKAFTCANTHTVTHQHTHQHICQQICWVLVASVLQENIPNIPCCIFQVEDVESLALWHHDCSSIEKVLTHFWPNKPTSCPADWDAISFLSGRLRCHQLPIPLGDLAAVCSSVLRKGVFTPDRCCSRRCVRASRPPGHPSPLTNRLYGSASLPSAHWRCASCCEAFGFHRMGQAVKETQTRVSFALAVTCWR